MIEIFFYLLILPSPFVLMGRGFARFVSPGNSFSRIESIAILAALPKYFVGQAFQGY